jgi:hypothetical protein
MSEHGHLISLCVVLETARIKNQKGKMQRYAQFSSVRCVCVCACEALGIKMESQQKKMESQHKKEGGGGCFGQGDQIQIWLGRTGCLRLKDPRGPF